MEWAVDRAVGGEGALDEGDVGDGHFDRDEGVAYFQCAGKVPRRWRSFYPCECEVWHIGVFFTRDSHGFQKGVDAVGEIAEGAGHLAHAGPEDAWFALAREDACAFYPRRKGSSRAYCLADEFPDTRDGILSYVAEKFQREVDALGFHPAEFWDVGFQLFLQLGE